MLPSSGGPERASCPRHLQSLERPALGPSPGGGAARLSPCKAAGPPAAPVPPPRDAGITPPSWHTSGHSHSLSGDDTVPAPGRQGLRVAGGIVKTGQTQMEQRCGISPLWDNLPTKMPRRPVSLHFCGTRAGAVGGQGACGDRTPTGWPPD